MQEDYFQYQEAQFQDGSSEDFTPSERGKNIFGPWTSAEWMNNSKVINTTNFFTFIRPQFQTYFWTIVRRNLEWYNGFVYGIHNKGILSSRIGTTICNMSAQLTLSGGFRFEGNERAKTFLTDFAKRQRMSARLKQALPIHNAIGFTLAKLDILANNRVDISYLPGNRYDVMTDDDGNVLSFRAYIKMWTADPLNNETGYYLIEERVMHDGVPYARYGVWKAPIIASAPVFGAKTSDDSATRSEYIPPELERYVIRRYGKNIIGKTFRLPWRNIGAVVLKNSYSATGMDDYTSFSDSTIANCGTEMYQYDLTITQKEEHKYICQDFVAVPDTFINEQGDRGIAQWCEQNNTSFNSRLVKRINYLDPTKSVPFIYQSQLKLEEYGNEADRLLNRIASAAHFSPVTIAAYLTGGAMKTAREVTADENATRLTITDKRELLQDGHNQLLQEVLIYYGLVDEHGEALDFNMVFNAGALSNPYQEAELLLQKKRGGLISERSAVAKANPELSDEEVDKMIEDIHADAERMQSLAFGQENDPSGMFENGGFE